ncbi:hypothetical protein CSA80_02515 [Candidatus Saccharibacteria bacterium]|nr:MAG: hypothetical protein CSA80_02515 [Candidatus Saccharibacteria bacterium]
MRLCDIDKITTIDDLIEGLHLRLQTLYSERSALLGHKLTEVDLSRDSRTTKSKTRPKRAATTRKKSSKTLQHKTASRYEEDRYDIDEATLASLDLSLR